MKPPQDRAAILKSYSSGLYSDYRFYTELSDSTLDIDNGLLFLMAFWSMPSVVGFKNICAELNIIELPKGFKFNVLDIDSARPILEDLSKYEVQAGGNGEGYWFKGGKIVIATAVHTASRKRVNEIIAEIYS